MIFFEYLFALGYSWGTRRGDPDPARFSKSLLTGGTLFLFMAGIPFTFDLFGIDVFELARDIGGPKLPGAKRSPAAYILGIPSLIAGLTLTSILFRQSFRDRSIQRFLPFSALNERRAPWFTMGFFVTGVIFFITVATRANLIALCLAGIYTYVYLCARSSVLRNQG